MADPPPDSDVGDGSDPDRFDRRSSGVKPWQIVVGILGLVVLILVTILMFGAGEHGPQRHAAVGHRSPVSSDATAYGVPLVGRRGWLGVDPGILGGSDR